MRVISKRALETFCIKHPNAREPLQAWHKVALHCKAKDFNELKLTFGSADYVPSKYTVFNVGGNKFRVVCVILYNASTQQMFIKHVFTHKEYDLWTQENRGKKT